MNAVGKKAQVSFDVIIAILFGIIFFSAFGILATHTIELEKETAIRMQLKSTALDIAEIITASQALNEDNATFEVSYSTPWIQVPGEKNPVECDITIDTGAEQVEVETAGYTEKAFFVNPQGTSIQASNCGGKITVSK